VLLSLADATEGTFSDVVEFSLADDGRQLVFAVSARDSAKNGVFVVRPGAGDAVAAPGALLAGKGKYAKLTWDEDRTRLAFLSDRDDSAQPNWKLFGWLRQAVAAAELASSDTPGFRKEFAISDKSNLSFSKIGTRVFFGCAPPAGRLR
jgi:transcription elongation factor